MKIEFWCIGKTNEDYLNAGIAVFQKRIQKYNSFDIKIISDVKVTLKTDVNRIVSAECDNVMKNLNLDDFLVILDERGEMLTSIDFSEKLNKFLQLSVKRIIFLVGGAWGIHSKLKERANYTLSLSKMTFSHQMIRLFFIEQLYRSFSILNHEPYHNE
jgi:23S rRNA (pseudouridine1915-N3)-methyltransferase